jgi:hypothetical protein
VLNLVEHKITGRLSRVKQETMDKEKYCVIPDLRYCLKNDMEYVYVYEGQDKVPWRYFV